MGRIWPNRVTREVVGKRLNGEVITEVVPEPDIYGGATVQTASGWHQIRNVREVEE